MEKQEETQRPKAAACANHQVFWELSEPDKVMGTHSPCRLCLLAFRLLVGDMA